jgi:hypothetical protein
MTMTAEETLIKQYGPLLSINQLAASLIVLQTVCVLRFEILRRVGQQDQRNPLETRPPFVFPHGRSCRCSWNPVDRRVSPELTSVSAILGLNSISAADKRASAPRFNAVGSRKGSIASRQPHPLLSIVQVIPTESALDAGALGFMAKFLVQTTLPHSEQSRHAIHAGRRQCHLAHHGCRRDRLAIWQLSTSDSHLDDN